MDKLSYNKIKNVTVEIDLHNGDEYKIIGINKFKQLCKQLESSQPVPASPMKKKIIIDDDSEEYFKQPPKKTGWSDTHQKAQDEVSRRSQQVERREAPSPLGELVNEVSLPSDPNAVNLQRDNKMNLNYAPVSGGVLNASDMSRLIAGGKGFY